MVYTSKQLFGTTGAVSTSCDNQTERYVSANMDKQSAVSISCKNKSDMGILKCIFAPFFLLCWSDLWSDPNRGFLWLVEPLIITFTPTACCVDASNQRCYVSAALCWCNLKAHTTLKRKKRKHARQECKSRNDWQRSATPIS